MEENSFDNVQMEFDDFEIVKASARHKNTARNKETVGILDSLREKPFYGSFTNR